MYVILYRYMYDIIRYMYSKHHISMYQISLSVVDPPLAACAATVLCSAATANFGRYCVARCANLCLLAEACVVSASTRGLSLAACATVSHLWSLLCTKRRQAPRAVSGRYCVARRANLCLLALVAESLV